MTRYSIEDKLAYGPQSRDMARFLKKLDKREIEYNRTLDSDGTRYVDHADKGLRFTGKAHDVEDARIDHKGWYLDDDGMGETCWGVVYQLPSRNGECQYIPGTAHSMCDDGACLDFTDIRDNAKDAARAGDRLAERYAETEREYQRVESAKLRIEDITEEIKSAYATCRELCAEVRENCSKLEGMAVLKGLIRAEVKRVRREVRKLYRERLELQAEV